MHARGRAVVGRLVSGRVAADFHSHLLPELGYIGVSQDIT
jgi:hypothetical protein